MARIRRPIMAIHVEITDGAGFRRTTVDARTFWIGSARSGCDVEVEAPGCHGRIVQVRADGPGHLSVRAEAGLPFPVRSAAGDVGTRFESLVEGDVLNLGAAMVRLRAAREERGEEIDPGALGEGEEPGAPVGAWYQTFMDVADSLEAVNTPEETIQRAMEAILACTGADRVCVELDAAPGAEGRRTFHLAAGGDRAPFRVSRSLMDRARASARVVHVPLASADPVASRIHSVRQEGISSAITMPLRALGKSLGVLHADCVREGGMLTAGDLQRCVFVGRLLAGALGNRALVRELVRAAPAIDDAVHPALRTVSPACAEMVERIKLYAPTDYTVLIRGETGAGKEVVGHALHELSRRRNGPFVPVNCAAIPEQLMESMLFGHEKGAFTGATQSSRGHFEEAQGGTIFLDEIGDMALDLQAKILRVLQDRIVTPVGSRKRIEVDVRILAATHQDLERMVEEGRFREDLYYRLRELEIELPPLRARVEDIELLAGTFLAEAAAELGYEQVPELRGEALAYLRAQPWPGNVRELRHAIKGAALRAGGGPLGVEHFERSPRAPRRSAAAADLGGGSWKERLEAQERAALEETLEQAGGNLTRGARLFGVPRTTYREKLVKHGLLKGREKE